MMKHVNRTLFGIMKTSKLCFLEGHIICDFKLKTGKGGRVRMFFRAPSVRRFHLKNFIRFFLYEATFYLALTIYN